MVKKTALYDEHIRLKGKMVEFGGWMLPVQYSGVIDEHQACRNAAGLFDVSHMGEIIVEGADSTSFLDFLLTNDVRKLEIGQAQYSAMCTESGGIVDDLVYYKRGDGEYFVVVNASNTEKDFNHMNKVHELWSKQTGRSVLIQNVSNEFSQIALQGRKSVEILKKLTQEPVEEINYYHFSHGALLDSIPALISRTGYTGEDGFELYVSWEDGPKIWQALIEHGTPLGLKPCGLGARDTLRLEMKFALYGHELNESLHPFETGLAWVTKLDKGEFFGRAALQQIKESGYDQRSVALEMLDRGIPRDGYTVFDEAGNTEIGVVTSGTQSPSLSKAIGIGRVHQLHSKIGTKICVDIRGRKTPAQIVKPPFYKRNY